MSRSIPEPSSRFLRAAASERDGLVRHRAQLLEQKEGLIDELRALDETLGELERRLVILTQLTGEVTAEPDESTASIQAPTGRMIRGPAIRETAVKVLLEQPNYIEAIHYRDWFGLMCEAGYTIAGKDPLAVFLTQLTRSPVVRKSSQPGVYELDRQAPLRLRSRLDRLRSELKELAGAPAADADISQVRARRHELDMAISQEEKALEEALRVLRRDDPPHAALAAGG